MKMLSSYIHSHFCLSVLILSFFCENQNLIFSTIIHDAPFQLMKVEGEQLSIVKLLNGQKCIIKAKSKQHTVYTIFQILESFSCM